MWQCYDLCVCEVFFLKTTRCLTTLSSLSYHSYHQCKKLWGNLFSFLSMTITFFCCDVSSSSKSTILARSRFRKFLIAFAVSSRFSGKPLQMLRKNIWENRHIRKLPLQISLHYSLPYSPFSVLFDFLDSCRYFAITYCLFLIQT